MKRRCIQDGFSLLEVVAAILLLAIAFVALMQVAASSLQLTQRADGRSEAALWARSKLDSSFVADKPQVGHSEGRFDARYRWVLDVAPWSAPNPDGDNHPSQLYRLDLQVLWGYGSNQRRAQFSTLRLLAIPQSGSGP